MTEIITVDKTNPDPEALLKAARTIRDGNLIIYPTETVYGLGADASSDEAVARVFEAKSRPLEKPISVAVDSLSMSYHVGKLTRWEEDLIQKFLPGPLTMLVEARPSVSGLLIADTGRVGIRVPDHPAALEIIKTVNGPVTSTSANTSGNRPPTTVDEALDQLGEHVELAIDAGKSPIGEPSTVVSSEDGSIRIIREGPISESAIRSVLK